MADEPGTARLDVLRWQRDDLIADLRRAESLRDKAALHQRLMDVLGQIEAVERAQPAAKGTALDEFTRRRAEREAAGAPRPPKRAQRGR